MEQEQQRTVGGDRYSGGEIEMETPETPWFALRVRTRSEFSVLAQLERKGCIAFSPSSRKLRVYRDRRKMVEEPLFPGYVFCRFEIEQRLPIITTNGVAQIVGRGATPEPIPFIEIHALERLMIAGAAAQTWPYLTTGQKVVVVAGALQGIQGQLIASKGTDRLVISVDLLQRSVALEIDRRNISPLPESPCPAQPVRLSGDCRQIVSVPRRPADNGRCTQPTDTGIRSGEAWWRNQAS